jgi:membrane protease YdiL (CAAX protease family)
MQVPTHSSSSFKGIKNPALYGIVVVLLGLIVTEAGLIPWSLDILFIKGPLAPILMVVVLGLYWAYFSGHGAPARTSEARAFRFRAGGLSSRGWKWGLVGAFLIVICLEAGLALFFRFQPFPEAAFKTQYKVLDRMPVGEAWLVVVVSSMVAGICEETGFRGYMQVPLEKRFGPLPAIVLTSLVFMLLHLSKTWAPLIVPQIFCTSVLLGVLANRTGSLLPGIIAHSIFDIFNFSYWWSHLAGNFDQPTIFQAGVDGAFFVLLFAVLGSLVGFVWAMRELKKTS